MKTKVDKLLGKVREKDSGGYVESAMLDETAKLTIVQPDRPDIEAQFGTMALKKFWTGTQAAYDAINPKDANTIYHIEEA